MPSKRGGRSQYSRQKRYISRLISRESHRDHRKAESINLLTEVDIYDALSAKFKSPLPAVIRSYERGEVVSDSRGEGSLQKRDDEE